MNKYTCIYQYVSSRAGGAKVQLLHVCSLTLGGLLQKHSRYMVHVPHAFNFLCILRSISRVLVKVAYLLRVSVMLDAAGR